MIQLLTSGLFTLELTGIIWCVIGAADNQVLSQLSLGKRIPTGALDGPRPPTANAIAKGAASGILQLLDKVGRAES